jgi:carboxyl-terminal processing protease
MSVMFPRIIIGSLAATAMFAMPFTATAEERTAQDRAVMAAGRPEAALAGVWRSRGYGYILRITADRLDLFHVAGSFCYADPRSKRDPDKLFVYWRTLEKSDTIGFSGTPGQTRYVFDRIAELPAACTATTRWTPPQLAALVAATFADLYPSFRERGIDWAARTREVQGKLGERASADALFTALRAMLAGVNDPHVEVQAKIDGEDREYNPGQAPTLLLAGADPDGGDRTKREAAWQQAYRRGVRDVVLKGRGHAGANDRVIWGRVGDIGYLNILAMERFSPGRSADDAVALDAALDAVMAEFVGARAVILDISNNDGGFDSLAQHIAGRFADNTYLAYRKIAVGAQNLELQPFEVTPSPRQRFLGPVYMLTSDITLSAGEVFALYMRALPNVVHVGETTRGAFSDTTNKPLPNGWMLVLPTEIYRTPVGTSYEARGLPPQRRFEVFPRADLAGGHARRVNVLIEDIRRELGAR